MGRKSIEQKKKESHQKAVLKYRNKTYKTITISFNYEADKHILEAIENASNKTDFIRKALEEYINKSN